MTKEELIAALQPILDRVRRDVTAVKDDKGMAWTRQPLTNERLAKHLNGGPARGVCPIEAGASTTRLALLDLDSHKGEVSPEQMRDVAMKLQEALEEKGLAPIPFKSSGGRGIHLIMLWDEPQDAYSVRQTLTLVLESVGLKNGAKGVKSGQVEVFPKQDSVPADGFGNQFILPLAGESVPLDPVTLQALPREAVVGMQWPVSRPVSTWIKPERAAPAGSLDTPELSEVKALLDAIPNEGEHELDYDDWRNAVFAAYSATGGSDEGLALVHAFSARSAKYDPDFLDNRVWPYISAEGGRTIDTLRFMARQHAPIEDVFEVLDDAEPEKAPRFPAIQAADFAAGKPPDYIIKGVLPQAGLAVMFGESTAGKSFAALDMAMAIARGVEWRGRRVKQGRVVYIAAEGAAGVRNRLNAYARHHGVDLATLPLRVIADAPNLLEHDDAVAIGHSTGRCELVIVDTFAQSTPGSNENSAEDVGKALGHCRGIHRMTGALVLLVHHAGKDASKGARGWSGLKAAADAEIEVVRTAGGRFIRNTKQKDGEDGGEWGFDLQGVPVGMDEDGDVVTSCVVIEAAMPVMGATNVKPAGPVERAVIGAINEMALSQTSGIEVEAVLNAASKTLPEPEDRKRDTRKQRCKRALEKLCEGDDSPYWLQDGCISIV